MEVFYLNTIYQIFHIDVNLDYIWNTNTDGIQKSMMVQK